MEARHRADRRRAVAVRRSFLTALLALALVGAGCGGDDGNGGNGAGGDGGGNGSADVPDGAVATVDGEEISEERLDEQVAALRRAQSRGGASKLSREQLEQQALTTLLQTKWLEREAEERGVKVSMDEVRRRWRSAADEQFPDKRALRRFLGGQTEADVLRQLRLQTLTERIHDDIRANADGNPNRAVKQFQEEFQQSARESTACREGYDAPGCGD